MNNYDNFNEALEKENDVTARENLDRFYNWIAPEYKIKRIEFDDDLGKFMQLNGVDVILYKENQYGSIVNQIWIQEKVTFNQYKNLLFEYEKKSGAEGWAIDENEKAEWLIYYQSGDINFMNFNRVREYIKENLPMFKKIAYVKTDNHNVKIPITNLERDCRMKRYDKEDY